MEPKEVITPNTGVNPGEAGGTVVSPSVDETAARIKGLETELAESQGRVSGQTRSFQELDARSKAQEAEIARYKKYEQYVDFSELDTLVGGNTPTQQGTPAGNQQGAAMADPGLTQRMAQLEIKNLLTEFSQKNPDKAFVIQDADLAEKVEIAAFKEVQNERTQYGTVTSTPEQILQKAVDKTIAFHNKLIEKGKAMATESRKKIDVDPTDVGGAANKSTDAGTEEEYDSQAASRKRQEYKEKIRSGG